ncbi:T6SS immunity protein Tdi1 domain-containing protein [Erythrobacter crassostreae]|uniref:DUF1851 domain-containing protein n=1 Tax=Erythrobacter crassostreae TaxID=2828328 RepID=A0A9X1JLS8_9SPHN|nr:T6SS immunity protein Tdi1 domain-containing protein [Erythrobacter crassostrea]MBV7258639.1 DUF1851 domain-containing protein [Erythrobacter crassostrea]
MSLRKMVIAGFCSFTLVACSGATGANETEQTWAPIETAVAEDTLEDFDLSHGDLVANPSAFRLDHFIEEWRWLTGDDVAPLSITTMGDLIFKRADGKVLQVDTSTGELRSLAASPKQLEAIFSNRDVVERLFNPALIAELRASGAVLAEGEVYSVTKPVSRGGTRTPDNYLAIDMDVHFVLMGQIYRQLKDVSEDADIGSVTISD